MKPFNDNNWKPVDLLDGSVKNLGFAIKLKQQTANKHQRIIDTENRQHPTLHRAILMP